MPCCGEYRWQIEVCVVVIGFDWRRDNNRWLATTSISWALCGYRVAPNALERTVVGWPNTQTKSQKWTTSVLVNRGVLGYNLYAVALPDGVDILTIDGK